MNDELPDGKRAGAGGASLRNIGIVAHVDAGKTTLTEQILYAAGSMRHPGAVDAGSTVCDWLVEEQQRGITIVSAAATVTWRGVEITLVDTPGHVDFTVEVARSLTALDGIVVVLSGPDGVEAQTRAAWHQVARRALPVVGFINKLDRPGFDDAEAQEEIRQRLGIEPLPLYVPVVADKDRIALVDVLAGVRLSFEGASERSGARAPNRRALSEDEQVLRGVALERVIDRVAPYDDALAEAYLRGARLATEDIERALARATQDRACLPLVYGAARAGIGVCELLDCAVALLPSPVEARPPRAFDRATGRRHPDWRAPPGAVAAFAFKTEDRVGGRRLTWVRVFGGELVPGQRIARLPGGEPLVVPGLVRLFGGLEEHVAKLECGRIGALYADDAGTVLPRSGETLASAGMDATFESFRIPQPVLWVTPTLAPGATDQDQRRLRRALDRAVEDDPSLAVWLEPATGCFQLAGMGELHLDVVLDRVRREYGLDVAAMAPVVRPRQMIRRAARGVGRAASPSLPGAEVVVTLALRPCAGDREPIAWTARPPARGDWIEAIEVALGRALWDRGQLVGARAEVVSLEAAGAGLEAHLFRAAARDAARAALTRAEPVPAEPWMALSLIVPDAYVGRVCTDLARRRGRVLGSESRGAIQRLRAEAPLAELLQYATQLRSLTRGEGALTLEPLGYRAA